MLPDPQDIDAVAADSLVPSRPVKVVVTGGAGFIGHHLVRELMRTGHRVAIVDNLITGFAERLTDLPDVELMDVDIRDAEHLKSAMHGADTVFHLAALPSVQRSLLDPLGTHEINVTGTVNVMLAAAAASVRRVVFAGSSSVYGRAPGLPRREDQRPDPQSPYAVSKFSAELYVRTIGESRGIETVALRYFNIFGPGQDPMSPYAAVVPRFISALLRGERPTVHGDGQQTRDFTYVDNVVSANLLAAAAPNASGGVFNIGCGERHSLLDLLQRIESVIGSDVEPIFADTLQGDVRDSEADISLAADVLGYRPKVALVEGIERTVQWFQREVPR